MNKKGFTLIELLAVIVILAVIALIATPVVLNIINNAKKSATERSSENYIHAVELSVASYMVDKGKVSDGTYVISDGGKVIACGDISIAIEYNGSPIENSGTIELSKGEVTKAEIVTEGYKVVYTDGKTTISSNKVVNENSLYKLVSNGTIKIGETINYVSSYNSSLTWKVLGITSDGNVKIVSSSSVDASIKKYSLPLKSISDQSKLAQLKLTGQYIYQNIANIYNTESANYGDGAHVIKTRALNIDDVAEVLGVTLVDNNSTKNITGTFPNSSNVETREVIDNYNKLDLMAYLGSENLSMEALRRVNLLNVYTNLASTCINIWQNVAYLNVYRICNNWVEGYEVSSVGNDGSQVGDRGYDGSVFTNTFVSQYRPVIIIDGNTSASKDDNGNWNFS